MIRFKKSCTTLVVAALTTLLALPAGATDLSSTHDGDSVSHGCDFFQQRIFCWSAYVLIFWGRELVRGLVAL